MRKVGDNNNKLFFSRIANRHEIEDDASVGSVLWDGLAFIRAYDSHLVLRFLKKIEGAARHYSG